MRKLRTYMENTTLDIPAGATDELLAQYHHRLLSLEADLKDRAKAGTISSAVLARRVRRLKEIHRELNFLQTPSHADDTKDRITQDLGLPALSDCSETERSIVEHELKARASLVQAQSEQAQTVLSWLEDSLSGRAGGLRLTLRLSKLRNFIAAIERRTIIEAETGTNLDAQTESLLAHTQLPDDQENAKSSLAALITLFAKLDTTIARIAKLKASVKREQAKTDSMAAWLEREEKNLNSIHPAMPPPTPLVTAQAMRAIQPTLLHGIEQAKKHRDLVLRFWEQVVAPENKRRRAGASFRSESKT